MKTPPDSSPFLFVRFLLFLSLCLFSSCKELDGKDDSEENSSGYSSSSSSSSSSSTPRVTSSLPPQRGVDGLFYVVDDTGLPLEGVRIDWDHLRYTGPQGDLRASNLSGTHPNVTRATTATYDRGSYVGVRINTVSPVIAYSYDGSVLLFSFRRAGYAEATETYTVPTQAVLAGNRVGIPRTIRMRKLSIDVNVR